jgi:hypothetical protein
MKSGYFGLQLARAAAMLGLSEATTEFISDQPSSDSQATADTGECSIEALNDRGRLADWMMPSPDFIALWRSRP